MLYGSYDVGVCFLEVEDELTDQLKELLRVLIGRFSKFSLNKREKTNKVLEVKTLSLTLITPSDTIELKISLTMK